MHRRISTLMKGSISSSSPLVEYDEFMPPNNGSKTTIATVVAKDDKESLPAPSLKVKRVDNYYSRWGKAWKYRNTGSKITVEALPVLQSSNDQWRDYSFVVVRVLPRNDNIEGITYKIVIKSEYILKACQHVIGTWPGVSWNADPLELDPQIFITAHESFLAYERELEEKKRTELESNVLMSVKLLNSTIASDYRTTLATIRRLTRHGEITFDLIHAILVPRTLFVMRCAVTGLPRLLKLSSFQRITVSGKPVQQLVFESVDIVDHTVSNNIGIGKVQTVIHLHSFRGTVRIDSLDAYPLKYHPDPDSITAAALKRGKKWVSLIGVHHKQYNGIAGVKYVGQVVKHNVNSRIMIDRATFRRLKPNYAFAQAVPTTVQQPDRTSHPDHWRQIDHQPYVLDAAGAEVLQQRSVEDTVQLADLTEEELMLAPASVYGFSLGDKSWLEFNIELVEDVEWSTEAFENLVLPQGRKELLQSLVESHHRELGFDDFIKGKGHGLVVNLFGPPGVGKTFSAEATSEHVRRPLYIVGGGDLGTTASDLDTNLERVFDMATAWKAIVLIDEADVFLEQRSLHDLERNAMVAVFLRHVEYYRGILFLTTNRVKAFDEAFLSRIHVAMHFEQLTQHSKEKVWTAFIQKTGALGTFTPEQITALAQRDINGRQIKNAVRTAHSLAVGRGAHITFGHIMETLDAMDEFNRVFQATRK